MSNLRTEDADPSTVLERSASAYVQGADRRLASIIQTPNWTNFIKVEYFDRPQTWRLIIKTNNGIKEEVVFSVQGSIIENDLPPLKERPRMNATKFKYLKQSIKLAGLGTATFSKAMASTGEIFGYFDRHFKEGALETWSASNNDNDYANYLVASNRYMTPRKSAGTGKAIPFGVHVDPKDILKSMAGDNYVHTEDNQVLYYRRHTDEGGHIKHERVGPQMFRVGDIIEIQVSFVVVPLRGEKFKMLTVLRSATLIDGSFSQSSINRAKLPDRRAPTLLKRKVGYESDDVDTRATKRNMEIDGEADEDNRDETEAR